MASIKKRGKKYCVIYKVKDHEGKEHQRWETFSTKDESEARRKEIEYKQSIGKFEVTKCTTVRELLDEYV